MPPPLSCTWKVKRRAGRAEVIGNRREFQQSAIDVGDRNEVTGIDRNVVVRQRSESRQRRDLHRQQRVRRRVIWIGEAKVSRCKRVSSVLMSSSPCCRFPTGGSFTAFTVRSNVSVAVRPLVAVTVTVIVVVPL